jgi:hypothetical protein
VSGSQSINQLTKLARKPRNGSSIDRIGNSVLLVDQIGSRPGEFECVVQWYSTLGTGSVELNLACQPSCSHIVLYILAAVVKVKGKMKPNRFSKLFNT